MFINEFVRAAGRSVGCKFLILCLEGVSKTATPPTEWGEEKNIERKVAIDGDGSSTPIIWDYKVFLLTAIDASPALAGDQLFVRGCRFLIASQREVDRAARS
jgi:hypothetical protein